MHNNIIITI